MIVFIITFFKVYPTFPTHYHSNSNGGVIILGVGERQDGTWYTTGLKNADKLKRNFWNTIHDTKKVSINMLSDKNVESYEVNGDTILVIYVPRAKREQKPVYINNDLFGGCYRRDWEGDYHCSKAEIKGMLRDVADETEDMKIVEQFDISAIDTEFLKGFRNHHKSYRPEHVFNNLPDEEYLERIGAAGYGEDVPKIIAGHKLGHRLGLKPAGEWKIYPSTYSHKPKNPLDIFPITALTHIHF